MSTIDKAKLEGDYYHVRFDDPDKFETIRTPDWAENVANSVSVGSEVRMGKMKHDEYWVIQSALIKKEAGEEKAREKAKRIFNKIE